MSRVVDTGVIPECYVDTNLTETLTGIICNHQKGCANVVKQMQEKRADRFALGNIDKDKRSVGYVSEFVVVAGNEWLQVLKHQTRPHYLIYIIPAVEGFVLKAAEELNVSLADYELPTELKALSRITKQQDSKVDPRFSRLFLALKEASRLKMLKSVVEYLREHPYDAEVEKIKELVQF